MFTLEPCQCFSSRLGVLVNQAAEDFTSEGGAIYVITPAPRLGWTLLNAGPAARAVVGGERELFQEGPVVVLAEQLFETGKEAFDKLLLFFRCLRAGQPQRRKAIE